MRSATISKHTEKEQPINFFKCEFPAKSINEGFARIIASAFTSQLDPTIAEISDIKTAVSEAVTNCIVHAYKDSDKAVKQVITLSGEYYINGRVVILIKDKGCGIPNIKEAMQPLYTTLPSEERSGMGFSIMASFSDKLKVSSAVKKGTSVRLEKRINVT
ncbi:MAG: anti-sigma F factor [Clostridiales bacterium GWF2_38_85]|nr:MAG: anti-sigma F factor [Clostridiales bacterium GWF2_38_85]HBL84556.1 anti-sigma F factor [Clostridiales bacterium]